MVGEQLQAVFKNAQGKVDKGDKDGFLALPEGTTAALHVAHGGVGMAITRVEAVRLDGALLMARTTKREVYTLDVADVFAVAIEGSGSGGAQRRAGFG
jgi:hypothetical protein